ncbi:hypothetical protein ACFGVR_10505 [Mucilaginibacter sp. AW1-3]
MIRLAKYTLISTLMLPFFLLDGQDCIKLNKHERDDAAVEQLH